jgi:hypothetical protein
MDRIRVFWVLVAIKNGRIFVRNRSPRLLKLLQRISQHSWDLFQLTRDYVSIAAFRLADILGGSILVKTDARKQKVFLDTMQVGLSLNQKCLFLRSSLGVIRNA